MKLIKSRKYVINYIPKKEDGGIKFQGIAKYIGFYLGAYIFDAGDGMESCFGKEDVVREYKGEPTHIYEECACYIIGENPLNKKEVVVMVHNKHDHNPFNLDSIKYSFYIANKKKVKFIL